MAPARLGPCGFQVVAHNISIQNVAPFGRLNSWEYCSLSETRGAFRVTVDPTATNGLRVRSQVMADKPVTVRRERIGRRIGHLDAQDIARLNVALAFVMGLAG